MPSREMDKRPTQWLMLRVILGDLWSGEPNHQSAARPCPTLKQVSSPADLSALISKIQWTLSHRLQGCGAQRERPGATVLAALSCGYGRFWAHGTLLAAMPSTAANTRPGPRAFPGAG